MAEYPYYDIGKSAIKTKQFSYRASNSRYNTYINTLISLMAYDYHVKMQVKYYLHLISNIYAL